jgi:hypothetical protein
MIWNHYSTSFSKMQTSVPDSSHFIEIALIGRHGRRRQGTKEELSQGLAGFRIPGAASALGGGTGQKKRPDIRPDVF